ncbi:MAG TPA: hypothetical protein VFT37_05095 [Telluria sp.]|nr:hypothetical protein [Telluria sp.]
MRKRFGQTLRVGVADGALALAVTSPMDEARLAGEAAFDASSPGALGPALQALLGAEHARWPVSFVVADELVRMWQVSPPQGAARMADLQAAAALRFHGLYGQAPAEWAISASWDAVHPFLAAAMPRALVAALAQAADQQRMAVTGIEPHFVVAWNAWRSSLRAQAWFALVHGGVLTLGVPRGERLAAVRTAAVPAGAGFDWLVRHIEREALLLDLPAPASLALCGAVPEPWLQGGATLACTLLGRVVQAAAPAAQLALGEYAA